MSGSPDFKIGHKERTRRSGLARRRFDYAEAKQRYEAGESTVELARAYGVTSAATRAALLRMGVQMRKHWEVTHNLERANAAKKARTHCKRGHEYTPENLYYNQKGGRGCRACRRDQVNAKRAELRGAGIKRKPYARKPPTPRTVRCPSCAKTRQVIGTPGKRCNSCATTLSTGNRGRDLLCEFCGTQFHLKPSSLGRNIRFCSMSCRIQGGQFKEMGRKLSLDRGGDGNPAYKHGRRVDIQIPGWKLNNKGEHNCRACGSRERVELHHAIPRSKARLIRADLRNGVPLCYVCHRGWHAKKVTLYRDIFTEEEWAFISSVELTGELIGPWLDKHYPAAPLEAAA